MSLFSRKPKIPKYQFTYGKRPTLDSRFVRSRSDRTLRVRKPGFGFLHRFRKIFTLIIIFSVLALGIYGIMFSSYFKVKNIALVTEGFENENLSKEIEETLKSSLNKSIFWIDTDDLAAKVLSQFPGLEKITVNKDYPNTLSIEFSEYAFAANVINESGNLKKSYLINSIGFVVKEDFENPNLPYIKIKSDEPINTKNAVLEKNKLNYILESITYYQDKFGMKVKETVYKPIPRELHLLTERDFYIWLDIQRPYEEQFKKLKKAIVKLDIFKENLQYIDLRIAGGSGDKIIYKRK